MKMRRILDFFLVALSLILTACEPEKKNGPVTYSVAYHYVYNSEKLRSQGSNHGMKPSADGNLLARPAVQSQREMNFLFLPSSDGAIPTPIDFEQNFAIAVVLPETELDTEIVPGALYATADELVFQYTLRHGAVLDEPMQPTAIIVVDRQYERSAVRTQRIDPY